VTFLGWRMVGVAFLADFFAVGFLFYSFGVFLAAVEADLGASRTQISWALGIANLVGSFAAPLIGRALDRFPVRRIMLLGTGLTAAGFAALSQVAALWQFLAIFGSLLAVGTMAMGHLSSAKLVANWFEVRRGTALGIATVGISLSGLVMPPVATWLILNVGWRGGFLAYAAATLLVVAPVALLFVVSRPEDVGQTPDGLPEPEPVAGAPRLAATSWRTREILREPAFLGTVIPFGLGFFAISAVLTHLVPHARDLGIDAYRAATVLSFVAAAGMAGKVAFGWIADRLGAPQALALSLLLQLVGVVALLVAHPYAALVATGLLFGFGMGGMVPLQGAMLAAAFGRVSFGKAMGLMRPFQVPLHALGVPFAGYVFEKTGSYDLAFQLFMLTYVVAIAAALGLGRRIGGGR
jgi:MFS family permease